MKKKIGQKIRLLRLEKGYTQLNVAESVNVRESTYRSIEAGRTNLDIELLGQILETLETDLNDFMLAIEK